MAKEKFVLEYNMRNTPVTLLWPYISTSYGLKEWFADDARQLGKDIVLDWDSNEQTIQIIVMRMEKYVRYRWKEEIDKSYFEFKISQSELTDNTVLIVTDFSEPGEANESKKLWDYQVENLQRLLGCI